MSPSSTAAPRLLRTAAEAAMAAAMAAGRGGIARMVADASRAGAGDHVVDVGCGPGTAAREAARRGATVTGIDPSAISLALARRLTRRALTGVEYRSGTAESIPLPDGAATVAWSISSAHHWSDRGAAIVELYRVLAPGGRLVVAEHRVADGARGLAAHGLAAERAEEFAAQLRGAGFADVAVAERGGRRRFLFLTANRPAD